jgi:hypothetical protein
MDNRHTQNGTSTVRRISALTLALVLVSGGASAQENSPAGETITKVGTTAGQFLKIGVGARAVALGGAYVAEANDLAALYWNPAGLSRLRGSAVQLAYTDYLADIEYNFAAVGTNLGSLGTIAASIIYLDSGDMTVRTTDRPDPDEAEAERFSVQNLAMQVSYAKALTDRFSIGTTVKYIQEKIWNSSASGVAFDVGLVFTTPFEPLRLGASMANFGPKMQMNGRDILFTDDPDAAQSGNVEVVNAEYLTDKFSLPLLFRLGLAWDAVSTANHRIIILTDAAHPNDNSQYMNFGGEYSFRDLIFFRAGMRNVFEEDGEQGVTFGGGLNLRIDRSLRMRVDYAYADFGRLEQTHWFTLDVAF